MIPIPIISSAIILSVTLAMLALGFTLQLITVGIPNLAHGAIFVFTAYIALLFWGLGHSPYTTLPVAFLIAGAVTALIYKALASIQKRGAGIIELLIATLSFGLIIYGCINIFADKIAFMIPGGPREFTLAGADFKLMDVPGAVLASTFTCILLITIFHLLLTRTKFGVAMRAIIEDPALAKVQGVNTDLVLSVAWFFIGGLAGVSGVLYSMYFCVEPLVWILMLTRILCAVVIGGVRNPWGSFFGGILAGSAEVFGITIFGSVVGAWIFPYRIAIPTILVCIVLMLSPRGIIEVIWKRVRLGE